MVTGIRAERSQIGKKTGRIVRIAFCEVLRIDTNARNEKARRMYARLGYVETDIVPTVFNGIQGVDLVLMEKKL